jgi:hypothetical protein
MKRLLFLALVSLPVLALPTTARADAPLQLPCLPPFRVDAGVNAYFKLSYPGPQIPLPPWYTYFPYDAYFQTPPPTGYQFPNWAPPPMTSSYVPHFGPSHAPSPFPGPPPGAIQPTAVRPVGYYYQQAPSYWYGR